MNQSKLNSKSILASILVIFVFSMHSFLIYGVEPNPVEEITSSYINNTLLVKFKPGTPSEARRSLNASHAAAEKDYISSIDVFLLTVPKGKNVLDLAKAYRKNPNVEFAEPDYTINSTEIVNDPYFLKWQGGLNRTQAPTAWDITTGSLDVSIAVLDTGIASTHEDLQGRLMIGYNFIDNNGNTQDDNGHGTRVAGILGAATNNQKGIAGVTWLNPIMPVKVLGSNGSGSHSNIAKGIIYAVDHGAKVINMSLGSTNGSNTLKNAIDYAHSKNVVLVAAAGNSNGSVLFPAAYPNVIAVAAVDNADEKAPYSNFGPEISVSAPGNVMSTLRTGDYGTGSGTSFASPFVAGLAGLIISINPTLTSNEIQSIIEAGADDLGTIGWDQYYGWGRINMYNSLSLLGSQSNDPSVPPVTDRTPPIISLTGHSSITLFKGETYFDEGATAFDDIDGDITDRLIVSNLVNTSEVGTYQINYNVSDTAGNPAIEVSRTVIVQEAIIVTDPEPIPEPTPTTLVFTGTVGDKKTGTVIMHGIMINKPGEFESILSWQTARTDLNMTLVDPNGNIVMLSNQVNTKDLTERITVNLNTVGNYSIIIEAASGKTNYTLSVQIP